jgi:general secretion pathway protein F
VAIFSYRATTREGSILEGVVEAADEKEAVERLKRTDVIPLKVTAPEEGIKKKFSFRSSKYDLLTFTTELSSLLSAGLPLDRSLNIISESSESKETKKVVRSILKSISSGSSFSDALKEHPSVFPVLYVNIVRAGEAGGALDTVLDKLTEFLESAKELKEQVFSAMIYPVILVFTGGISIIILLTYMLPKFSVIFEELGSSLPLSTQLLLAFSTCIKSYWWVVLSFAVAGWIILRRYLKSEAGRYKWDSLILKVMGDIIKKLETVRFCRTLGTLLKSGVSPLQALNNAKDVIGNRVIASAVASVSKGVKEGKGIAGPLSETNVLPPLAVSMIKVGEETGQMDDMLINVASTYEKNLKFAIKKFVSFLEPALILLMGLIIGFVVLSMLMAIFSITELPF